MELQNCTLCGWKLRAMQINYMEALYTCPNPQCAYILNSITKAPDLIKRSFMKADVSEVVDQTNKLNSVYNPSSECMQDDDYQFLDDLLADTLPGDFGEDDIHDIGFEFEALQNVWSDLSPK